MSSKRVINDCQALSLPVVRSLLLHLEKCAGAISAREQYETKDKVPITKFRTNVERPPHCSLGLWQVASRLLNCR